MPAIFAQNDYGSASRAVYVDLMLISRQLERILRHAVRVADEAIAAAPADQLGQITWIL